MTHTGPRRMTTFQEERINFLPNFPFLHPYQHVDEYKQHLLDR